MTRASSIVLAALVITAAPARPELVRDVFPVPPVVALAFHGHGLTAFDPFHPWPAGNAAEAVPPAASDPGAEAARLPPGTCYDVMPVWTARGFKPHDGTRVLYHSPSQLLFAAMAPEDEAQVRAFCEWPPATWLSEPHRDDGLNRQILLRMTTYSVAAAGAGGWEFRPATVEEFFTLPAAARPIAGRQSMIIRSGQRAKVEGYNTPAPNRNRTLTGAITEAECTIGEDRSTIDLNLAPQFAARLGDGSLVVLSPFFQQCIEWGNSWLMEAGTLPGHPPRRLFQFFEVLRVNAGMHSSSELAHCRQRWTGRAGDEDFSADGRVIELLNFPEPAPREPVAEPGFRDVERRPEVTVPELFGEVPVHDMSAAWEAAAGIPHGRVHAWRRGGDRYYLHGSRDGIAAVQRWLDRNRPSSVSTATVEATVTVVSADGGTSTIIWRGSIPVHGGQRSRWGMSAVKPEDTDDSPPDLAEVDIEASRIERPGPDISAKIDFAWQLTAAASLTPPWTAAPVKLDDTTVTGDRRGVTLERTIGQTVAGDSIVLNMQLRGVEVRSPAWCESPLHEWWWRRQLKKAGR